jgi:hypothetical protein
MAKLNYYLVAGGVVSGLISIMHFVLVFQPALYRYIRAGQESELGLMAEQGSIPTTIATSALALIFAIWAVYAFSGARLLGPLPVLRPALIAIAAIYMLRALALLTEVNMVINQGYPFQFVVFSTISLVTGLLYLIGGVKPL